MGYTRFSSFRRQLREKAASSLKKQDKTVVVFVYVIPVSPVKFKTLSLSLQTLCSYDTGHSFLHTEKPPAAATGGFFLYQVGVLQT